VRQEVSGVLHDFRKNPRSVAISERAMTTMMTMLMTLMVVDDDDDHR